MKSSSDKILPLDDVIIKTADKLEVFNNKQLMAELISATTDSIWTKSCIFLLIKRKVLNANYSYNIRNIESLLETQAPEYFI